MSPENMSHYIIIVVIFPPSLNPREHPRRQHKSGQLRRHDRPDSTRGQSDSDGTSDVPACLTPRLGGSARLTPRSDLRRIQSVGSATRFSHWG